MKKAKAPMVPVLEKAFELNMPKLMQAVKASGSSRLVLAHGDERTVVVVAETRLAVVLGGRTWMVDIVAVPCLGGRWRPLLKCPRAHEGNFQSLYFRADELACRHCHALRYLSNLAPSQQERVRYKRFKLERTMHWNKFFTPVRRPGQHWSNFRKALTKHNGLMTILLTK